jgi:hypothetical protein
MRGASVSILGVAGIVATLGAAHAQPADTLRVGNWDFPPGREGAAHEGAEAQDFTGRRECRRYRRRPR